MGIEEVKEWLLADMREGVRKVVSGEIPVYRNKFLSPDHIISFIEGNGAIDLDQHDSNGWEYDNWHYYKIDDRKYTVSGAGYYGGIAFELSDDQEDEIEEEENIESIKEWE